MEIADHTKRFRLLGVVHMYSVLSGNSVDDSIWQTEGRHWS